MDGCRLLWRQTIIWTNDDLWSIGPLGSNFIGILLTIIHARIWILKCCLQNGGHFYRFQCDNYHILITRLCFSTSIFQPNNYGFLHFSSFGWFAASTCVVKFYIMMTSSNGNIFRVTGPLCGEFTGPGEFPTQRPVTRSFDVFFDLRLNKRLSKQPWGWWFETPSWSLWRQCNV